MIATVVCCFIADPVTSLLVNLLAEIAIDLYYRSHKKNYCNNLNCSQYNSFWNVCRIIRSINLDFSIEYVKCLSNCSICLNEQKDFFWAKCMIDVARNSLRKLSVNLNMEIALPPDFVTQKNISLVSR